MLKYGEISIIFVDILNFDMLTSIHVQNSGLLACFEVCQLHLGYIGDFEDIGYAKARIIFNILNLVGRRLGRYLEY